MRFITNPGARRGVSRGLMACLLLCLLWALVCPAAAAPTELVPVGRCVGITLDTQGVTVVGFAAGDSAAQQAGLQPGDRIIAIGETAVDSPAAIRAALQPGTSVVLRVLRGGRENSFTVQVPPEATLGMLVRDGISGIGTVTFYDPDSGLFGALGHGVSEEGGQTLLPVEMGQIVPASVVEVVPGQPGQPGTLRGAYEPTILGQVERNTPVGIFGHGALSPEAQALPLGEPSLGGATILANVSGSDVGAYEVQILDLDPRADTRNLLVEVTDPRLLAATGGIVQGMSGSPIIQDGKLIGAVTHVLVNDPTRGYGIFIENMLEAAG